MGEYSTLEEVAEKIKSLNKKVIILYAFNATGKTRLSMEYKDLVNQVTDDGEIIKRVIYYNSFTEDLFFWDNDLDQDINRVMKINKNSTFINLIERQGKEKEIAEKFKEFTSSKIEPKIDTNSGEITFRISTGDDNAIDNIKISRGEESIFIWSVFYVLIESIISELNIDDINDRSTDEFNTIEHIFIDDPIPSLDDNHAIDAAIRIKKLISESKNENLKFIITTHHALFYNVLYNELHKEKKKDFYLLNKKENGYMLEKQKDSPFGYHLLVKQEIQNAIDENRIEKFHFALFRNLLEKTATYLGYSKWGDLLIGEGITQENIQGYIRRINLYSHNKHSEIDAKELISAEKEMLKLLYRNFIKEFKWRVIENE